MTIHIDEIVVHPDEAIAAPARRHGRQWCHLWCDPGEEEQMHALAERIGLQRSWFQRHRLLDHYDLTPAKRTAAIAAGAVPISMRAWLRQRRHLP